MAFFQSEFFADISNFISLVANLCVLFMTAYTLYLTAFSRKIGYVSKGNSFNMFFGDTIHFNLKNQSLHSIPVSRVFLLKRIDGMFYNITIAKYDDPLIMDAWHIQKIESEPFTEIADLEKEDGTSGITDIHMDAVIGIDSGDKVIWVKPYKKAPLFAAKRAFRKGKYDHLTVSRYYYDDRVLSKTVKYAIHLKVMDVNGQKRVKTVFMIVGSDGGILSEEIYGYNGVNLQDCVSADKLKQHFCEQFGIANEDIIVCELHQYSF